MRKTISLLLVLLLAFSTMPALAEDTPMKIGIVYKQTGNPYYDAAVHGFEDAQEELNMTFTHNGPSDSSNEGQIQIIEGYIQQGVDAIAIAANDEDGCASVLQVAMEQGIKVVSFDSRVNSTGRILHVDPADYRTIAIAMLEDMAQQIGGAGQIAILSAAATMSNQNIMIAYIQEELEKEAYADIELITIVYGDDMTDKSYQEMQGLIDSYPNLKGVISPTTVGLAAAATCVQDNDLGGVIKLTGFGLPSEMVDYVKAGVCESMHLWNPIDMGYCAAYICANLVRGTLTPEIGTKFDCGRLGTIEILDEGDGTPYVISNVPMVFTSENIDEWKDVF